MEASTAAVATAGERATEAPALAVEGVSHAFGKRQVLRQVSLTVRPGDFTVLLGLNGAGKTTLFSLITRLYDHRSGTIAIFGFPVKDKPSEALQRIGVVFQQPTLDLDLTIAQNLFYHAALHGIARCQARERIDLEIGRIGLTERLHDKVRLLSGGQRRRVEIARALLHRPRLLLLDEPTVGLDIASRQFLLDHVRGLCRSEGLGVLWATHLIDEVDPAGRVVVLHQGEVRGEGPVAALLRETGSNDMRGAFDRLTREQAA